MILDGVAMLSATVPAKYASILAEDNEVHGCERRIEIHVMTAACEKITCADDPF